MSQDTEKALGAQPMTQWQIARYGDTESTRLALAYFRERRWPVDDQLTTGVDDRVFAFKAGFEAALAATKFSRLADVERPVDETCSDGYCVTCGAIALLGSSYCEDHEPEDDQL